MRWCTRQTAAGEPQVSHDGTRVVYTLGRADRDLDRRAAHIYSVGCRRRRRAPAHAVGDRNSGGRWSPRRADRLRLRPRQDGTAALFVLPLSGGEAREITRHASASATSPGRPTARDRLHDELRPGEPGRGAPAEGRRAEGAGHPPDRLQAGQPGLPEQRAGPGFRRGCGERRAAAAHRRRAGPRRPQLPAVVARRPDASPRSARTDNGMQSQLALIDVATGKETLVGPEDGVVGVFAGRRAATGSSAPATRGRPTSRLLRPRRRRRHDHAPHRRPAGPARRRLPDDHPALAAGLARRPPGPVPRRARRARAALHVIDSQTGGVEPVKSWRALNVGLQHRPQRALRRPGATPAPTPSARSPSPTRRPTRRRSSPTTTTASSPSAPPPSRSASRSSAAASRIEAWLLKPPGFDPAQKYPLVLDVHGGPNGFYGWGFKPLQQALAAAGFLVAYSNPRGSSSYGRDFTQRSSATGATRTSRT